MSGINAEYLDANTSDRSMAADVLVREEPDDEEDEEEDEDEDEEEDEDDGKEDGDDDEDNDGYSE